GVEVPSIQVADGDHAVEPAVSIYDGQMADAAVHHGAAGFVDGRFLGAADNLDRHHVVHDGRGRVTPFADYPPQHVALGEHASDSAVVDHDQSADLVLVHEERRVEHGRPPADRENLRSLLGEDFSDDTHDPPPSRSLVRTAPGRMLPHLAV